MPSFETRVFETPGKVAVRIGIGGGHVAVDTVDGAETAVEVEALRDDEATLEAVAAMTIDVRDRSDSHEIVVEAPKRQGGWLSGLGRGPKIGVRVRCPHGSDLRVATSSADVEADGRFGDLEVNTASGDLALDVVEGTAKVNSASGDVSLRDVGGSASIKTASGDVHVGRARGPLSVNGVSGDVEIREAHDDLSVTTVSGDQEIESLRGGEHAKVQSVSGDVRVAVAPGLRLWIDGSSVSGSLRSELELELDDEAVDDECPLVELKARTVSGDVHIVRGAPVV